MTAAAKDDFGMERALRGLAERGYTPEVVYDVGAADAHGDLVGSGGGVAGEAIERMGQRREIEIAEIERGAVEEDAVHGAGYLRATGGTRARRGAGKPGI